MIASSAEELAAELSEVADGDTPYQAALGRDDHGPVWVFSGQGSQWTQMGAELLANEPVFAATVAEAEPVIARESGFSVTEAMSAPQTVTGIDRVQPTIFTMQVALAATMKSYGVRPGAVIGHSLGEAAAAVVAGALSLEDGLRLICRRSRLMSRIAGAGAMASVELPAQQVLSELMARGIDDVAISVIASPKSTVIGGATETVRELVAAWEQRDVMAREIAVDVASHSPQVDPILDELADVLAELNPDDAGGSVLFGDPVRPARAAGVRCRLLAGQSASHRTVRRGGAGGAGRRASCVRRAVPTPIADLCRRADRRQPGHAGDLRWPVCGASSRCRTGCAACWRTCTARAPRWTSRRCTPMADCWMYRCRPGPTVSCCLARDGQDSSVARRLHRRRASAAGLPRALAGGAGAPRVAG